MKRLLLAPLIFALGLPIQADLGDAEVSVEKIASQDEIINPSDKIYQAFCGEVSKKQKTKCTVQFRNGLLTVNDSSGLDLKRIKDIKYEFIGKWTSFYWWHQYTFIYESENEKTTPEKESIWPLKMPWDSNKELKKELKAAKITMGFKGQKAANNFKNDLESWIGGTLWTKCTGPIPTGIRKTIRCDDNTNSYDPAARARAISGALAPLNNALQQRQQRNNYVFPPSTSSSYGTNSYQNQYQETNKSTERTIQNQRDFYQDLQIQNLQKGF
tara:strand:+ start:494 stop:1306 length:813 start_codon:yes stop_codon:yes gene_type:complete